MFKRLTAAILSLAFACVMGTSASILIATPAAAMKTGQAILACAANLKCTDSELEDGEHVMCVKGGGCVLCDKGSQGKCIPALRAHESIISYDPAKILMSPATSPTTTTPKTSFTGAFTVDTGNMGKSGGTSQTPAPTRPNPTGSITVPHGGIGMSQN